jgi:hypothetical protein
MAAQPEATEQDTATASPLDRHASPVSDRTSTGARKDGRATAAMIVGILSIPITFLIGIVGLIMGIVAIILGAISRGNIKRSGLQGAGQATAGIICGAVSIVIFIALVAVIASNNT